MRQNEYVVLFIYLVSRTATSWCSGCSSPFMLSFFCHLQKLFKLLSAWCVIFKSSCQPNIISTAREDNKTKISSWCDPSVKNGLSLEHSREKNSPICQFYHFLYLHNLYFFPFSPFTPISYYLLPQRTVQDTVEFVSISTDCCQQYESSNYCDLE